MSTVLVVGSGPSGVHLAQTLLERGQRVTMLDVGHERPAPVLPLADFDGVKDGLDDPVNYFLGASGEAVVFPARHSKYYVHPPSKSYVFSAPEGFRAEATGFEPVISFAAGGLAEAWTGGSYPLNESELADFPFRFGQIEAHYRTVIRRIGVTAQRDDLARFNHWFEDYLEPLAMDPHSSRLLERYDRQRTRLNRNLRFYLGRSRVAVLSRDLGARKACANLGRCLWGCPHQALYAPSSTLNELRRHPNFRYVPGAFATHFNYEGDTVSGVVVTTEDGQSQTFVADVYALAAGALCSSKLLLDSIFRRTGNVHELDGLMDNRQIMIPFLSMGMLGQPASTHAYQFHQVALGIERERPEEYIHGQITALKAASIHPVLQSLPVDLRSALLVFRQIHAALGVANVWLHDRRAAGNILTVRPRHGSAETDLVLRYTAQNSREVSDAITTVKRALRALGCIAPPGMTKILQSGASVHYAGTLPMSRGGQPFSATPDCRSSDFRNLYLADGATFPFLPAKNLTFTLMANSIRVGEAISRDLVGA